jgi:hypothetical protein
MKKSFATISVIIYLAFTCGVMINMHYCMDSFDSVRLYTSQSDYCTKCGMHTGTHGCCHDEVTIIKLNDDHQTSDFDFSLEAPAPLINVHPAFKSPDFYFTEQSCDYLNHLPPLLTKQDTYLQNCVFRI